METLNFVATIILLTASGALAPGPLFFANLSKGAKLGAKSGLMFSLAHTLVEFTLVVLLALGLLTVASELAVKLVIGVAGGIVLVAFGVVQIYGSLVFKSAGFEKTDKLSTRGLFLIGLTLTGLNPFFVVWWLTVGAQLIILSLELASLAGVLFMYVCHVWMDYVWLTATAYFAKIGVTVIGFKWYRLVLGVFGAVLIYFGLTFLASSFSSQN